MVPTNRQANLERLCSELNAHVAGLGIEIEPSPEAERLSRALFLAHSASDKTFAKICRSQSLLSPEQLALAGLYTLRPDSAEVLLSTSDFVFFYVAPFRYPETGCGLLFAPTLEAEMHARGLCTPFDSGGLVSHFDRYDPNEELASFLARHELPIPGHRTFLGHCMAALFEEPRDYVEGKAPHLPGPLGLTGGDDRRWTHEVRIADRVHVFGSTHLKAVFVPRGRTLEPDIEALLTWCEQEGVDQILYDSSREDDFERLQKQCLRYIQRALY